MTTVLVLLIIVLAILVVVSLVRGVVAFLQSTKLDLENPQDEARVSEMQAKQNKMMFNRIKYQALAIVVVVVLLSISQ